MYLLAAIGCAVLTGGTSFAVFNVFLGEGIAISISAILAVVAAGVFAWAFR